MARDWGSYPRAILVACWVRVAAYLEQVWTNKSKPFDLQPLSLLQRGREGARDEEEEIYIYYIVE